MNGLSRYTYRVVLKYRRVNGCALCLLQALLGVENLFDEEARGGLQTVHDSDAMQRPLGYEDASSPERGRRLSYRHGAETAHVAYEPEAVQESVDLHRPAGPGEMVDGREMLGQGTKVGVLTRIPGGFRTLLDRRCPCAIVSAQRKLVEELAHDVAELLTFVDTPRQPGKRLAQLASARRMCPEPVRVRREGCGHGLDGRRWTACRALASVRRRVFVEAGDRVDRQLTVDSFELFEIDAILTAPREALEADETA